MAVQSSIAENKALARRFFEEVQTMDDIDTVDDIFAESYVHHDTNMPEPVRGRDAFKESLSQWMGGFSDATMTVLDQVAEGDRVVSRVRMEGSHDGPLQGMEPTNKHVEIEGIVEHRIENGRIVEGFPQWDIMGMMQQLGAMDDQRA
ncbi:MULTISPECIES: ester cyclase [unclassified Haladaptatus]|uniref:ester cyclase n=1 Tax=unclassified Haladaptatus TaxID=2622732 RepID=UPI0023E89AA6|nr:MULTISPECIES: ester cyclase [unclassified Haladaptatus]